MAKKINIKKFFTNTKSNEVLTNFYKYYEIDNVPFIPESTSSKDRASILFDFYKNIEDTDKKKDILSDISLISPLCTVDGIKICENIYKNKSDVSLILSESLHDIAISYFLNNKDTFIEAKRVHEVYTKSGWQRYPAQNKKIKDLSEINKNLKETFKSILSNQNNKAELGETENTVTVETTNFEDLYITTISDEDTNVYLVYMPDYGEVLVKAKGKKETLYEYAETYMRNMTGESIENKVIGYDITPFLDIKNIGDNTAPLGNSTGVRSWHMKNIELVNNNLKQKIKLTFPTLSEKPGSFQMWEMINELNLKDKLTTLQISKINILFSLFDENNTDKKININLSLSSNASNLNIINKSHRLVDEMLKKANINIGFVDIDTEE